MVLSNAGDRSELLIIQLLDQLAFPGSADLQLLKLLHFVALELCPWALELEFLGDTYKGVPGWDDSAARTCVVGLRGVAKSFVEGWGVRHLGCCKLKLDHGVVGA